MIWICKLKFEIQNNTKKWKLFIPASVVKLALYVIFTKKCFYHPVWYFSTPNLILHGIFYKKHTNISELFSCLNYIIVLRLVYWSRYYIFNITFHLMKKYQLQCHQFKWQRKTFAINIQFTSTLISCYIFNSFNRQWRQTS